MPDIFVEKLGAITIVTLNRPEKLNAITSSMREELIATVREFDGDEEQSVLIVTASGERAFCAGFDLAEMAANVSSGERERLGTTDIFGFSETHKPVIAAVNGLAVAGGFEMTLNCDITVASSNAWFALSEPRRGFMASVGVNLLPRMTSPGNAMYMLATAERFTVQDAFHYGLVQSVVENNMLRDEAIRIGHAICLNSQPAVQATKRVVRYWRQFAMRECFAHYGMVNEHLLQSDDGDGARAFIEGRQPNFPRSWPLTGAQLK